MVDTTYRWSLVLVLLLLAACADDGSATSASDDVADAATTDAGTDTPEDTAADPDAPEDTTPAEDGVEDTAPDAVEDSRAEVEDAPVEVEDVEDVEEVEDVEDVEETGDVADDADGETGDADTDVIEPVACGDEIGECEDPFVCIDDLCRLTPEATVAAEELFDIVEPEELTRIFAFLKSLASNVKFMVIEVPESDDAAALDGRYGAADIVTEVPLAVSWQEPEIIRAIRFVPLGVDEWMTETFDYELRANAVVEFPGLEPVSADFGLNALDVSLLLTLFEFEAHSLVLLSGVVTREEAESREMLDRDALPGFAELFCSVPWDPGEIWNLSDVLDCNEAPMDIDYDRDGTMDAYRVVVDALFEPALLVAGD